jgi:hypothetical protein
MTISLNTVPTSAGQTFTITVRYTPGGVGAAINVPGYSYTYISTSPKTYTYYNSTFTFNTGDYLHVFCTFTNDGVTDLSLQLDMF